MPSTRLYPLPTVERRNIVRDLGEYARTLDAEADSRATGGSHNWIVRSELMRAAGVIRLVATLVVNGTYSTAEARRWIDATQAYLIMVSRVDSQGVIR